MVLEIEKQDNTFRAKWQGFSTDWLPDTPSNRKALLVSLRMLHNEKGKALFTLQELAVIFDSDNRQAASGPMERFRDCGSDFLSFLVRKRKVNSDVVEAVSQVLLDDPLAEIKELVETTNKSLDRDDLTEANIVAALEQISCNHIRGAIQKQITKGEAHYQKTFWKR